MVVFSELGTSLSNSLNLLAKDASHKGLNDEKGNANRKQVER